MAGTIRLFTTAVVSGAAVLAACQKPADPPANAPETAPTAPHETSAPQPKPLPPVDTVNAQQFVNGQSVLTPVVFDRTGSTTVEGVVAGDTAPIYAVPVAAGQTLTVAFKSASTNLYVNVSDANDHSGAALHRGDVDGPTATLKADRDMTFVIAPFQPRATARRGETARFRLTVSRN
jgi:hypothetical protein